VGHCQHGSIFVAIDVIAPAKRDHSAFQRPVRGLDFGAGQNIRAVSCRVTLSSIGTKKPTISVTVLGICPLPSQNHRRADFRLKSIPEICRHALYRW
jgi:hypothetical protein